jgi:uncharacterized protein YktA (UPF0223 family)
MESFPLIELIYYIYLYDAKNVAKSAFNSSPKFNPLHPARADEQRLMREFQRPADNKPNRAEAAVCESDEDAAISQTLT